MSINYIDDNGVRQIFSDIKSNLDNINNTAVLAYDKANEAYTIASSGSITPSTQTFNIEGNKTFNINNGFFNIDFVNTNNTYVDFKSDYIYNCNGISFTTNRKRISENINSNLIISTNSITNKIIVESSMNDFSYSRYKWDSKLEMTPTVINISVNYLMDSTFYLSYILINSSGIYMKDQSLAQPVKINIRNCR